MKNNRNIFMIINMIVVIIFLVIVLSRCKFNNYDVYSINLTCQKSNCEMESDDIYINDINGNYLYQKELQIFNKKIFPGVSGKYYFRVNNDSGFNIKYQLYFSELFNYKVNMKYRLKKNDKYVVGNEDCWVDVEEVDILSNKTIKNSYDNYLLEWKWDDSNDEVDNIAGLNSNNYLLNINFLVLMVD